jgi:hypothetical protein
MNPFSANGQMSIITNRILNKLEYKNILNISSLTKIITLKDGTKYAIELKEIKK